MTKALLLEYQKLSEEYDKILDLSKRLLYSLREKDDKKIAYLLEEKSKIARRIKLLSEKVSNVKPSFEDKNDIYLSKRELKKIENKAYRLLELEEKVKLSIQDQTQ